jgi:histidinol dehydrogenase
MRCERLSLTGDAAQLAGEIRRLVPPPESVQDAVAAIVADVRARGDDAVGEYTRRFDTHGAEPAPLLARIADLEHAGGMLDPAVRKGLELAIENVGTVAQAGLRSDREVNLGGHAVTLREAPVERAGVYVPGGRAPYPSTVAMGVVTARVAGVPEIVVCAPPGRTGDVDPVVLGAARIAGATRVYRMGGAQAIAALAYGTETVEPVDVIVGPGNLYVQEAKRQVSGQVGIDGFAGPSDLMAVADENAPIEPLALDLLAQAEHGPGTLVVAVSSSPDLLEQLHDRLAEGADTDAVACLVQVADAEAALALAQAFAPEHLQLIGALAEALAGRVTRAGCVFVGPGAGTAFGDYIAGSNHVLPTNGAARFASSLSPAHFRRGFTEVRISADAAARLARAAAPVARAEGFELHAQSMEARIRENG